MNYEWIRHTEEIYLNKFGYFINFFIGALPDNTLGKMIYFSSQLGDLPFKATTILME